MSAPDEEPVAPAAAPEQSAAPASGPSVIAEPPKAPTLWDRLEPLLYSKTLAYLVVGLALAWAGVQYHASNFAGLAASHDGVVVFDPIKLANAERAVASQFLARDGDPGKAGVLLARVRAEAERAIREVAGSETLVLVRQAVVVNEYPDITDQVLARLGLPTDVPTTADVLYADDVAPSAIMGQVAKEADSGKITLRQLTEKALRGGANSELVP